MMSKSGDYRHSEVGFEMAPLDSVASLPDYVDLTRWNQRSDLGALVHEAVTSLTSIGTLFIKTLRRSSRWSIILRERRERRHGGTQPKDTAYTSKPADARPSLSRQAAHCSIMRNGGISD
jgi:hypothetical protein